MRKRTLSLLLAAGIFGEGIVGESSNNVILLNHTGLKIARVTIGERRYEDPADRQDKIFVSVTPRKHRMELLFRGGVLIDWPSFDFHNVHEIVFDLEGNHVSAHPR